MQIKISVLAITLLCLISGCEEQFSEPEPEPRPLARDYEVFVAPKKPLTEPNSRFSFEEPKGNLTLKDTVTLTLLNNPGLASFSWETRAQEAKEIQAGLIPNPELTLGAEEFGGTGETSGFDTAQTTIQVSQIIETAGKRLKRKNLAALDKTLSRWDYETKRLEVVTDAAKTFIDVLVLQDRIALTNELVDISEQVSNTVSARVEAGKVSPLEETKAKVALANVRIESERLKNELNATRKRLAAFWGGTSPTFTAVDGNLFDFESPPDTGQITGLLLQNPDIARWPTELKQRQASVELEKSKAVPDLTLSAGTQYFNGPDDKAFIVGLTIPLPVANRNQGAIAESQIRLSKAYRESQDADLKVRTAFEEAYQLLSASYKQATALKNEIVPGAQSAFNASEEGYRQGKFGYLDVLDAQRTFFEAKGQYIEVLASYHKARADLERLIGQKVESITSNSEAK